MRPFLFDYQFSFCYFLLSKLWGGHDFLTQLKMCVIIFDLFPLILSNQNVIDEMGSYVALMPVVMRFSQTD